MANNEMLELVNYKNLDAVIFDMDGVLIDSEPFYAGRFERFFRAYDKPYTHEIKSQLAGASNQLEFEIVRRYWGEDISVDELKSMFKQVNNLIRPDYKEIANLGASEVLTRLSEAGLRVIAVRDERFGYKFVAKTHRLAYGMKATFLWVDFNIEQIYYIRIKR